MNFHLRKSSFRGNGTGFLYFDRAKGRLASSAMSVTLAGTMDIEIGGSETQVDLLQTHQTTVRTMDANPIGDAPPREERERLRKENERLRKDDEQLRKDNERLRQRLQAVNEALRREDTPKK